MVPSASTLFTIGVDAALATADVTDCQERLLHAMKRLEASATKHAAAKARCREAEDLLKSLSRLERVADQELVSAHNDVEVAKKALAVAKAPVHPVQKAPLEVLGLIFQLSIEPLPSTDVLSFDEVLMYERQVQPFYFAQVCRRWRQASLSAPRAWSAVELKFDNVAKENTSAWNECISTCLRRSGCIALSVRLSRMRRPKVFDIPLIHRIVYEILPRCRSLALEFTIIENGDFAIPLFKADTPLLRELHLGACGLMYDRTNSVQFFPLTPMLESVVSDAHFFGKWALTTVSTVTLCRSSSVQHICQCLSATPEVKHLSLHWLNLNDFSPRAPTGFPSVMRLVILHEKPEMIRKLARAIKFTGLTELQLLGSTLGTTARIDYFQELTRLGYIPHLQSLVISQLWVSHLSSLLGALHLCKSLRSLTIAGSRLCSNGLQLLYGTLGPRYDGWICPDLVTLNLADECSFEESCNQEPLARLAEARITAAKAGGDGYSARLASILVPATTDQAICTRIRDALADIRGC